MWWKGWHLSQKNYPIIGLEPSEILTIRDEYLDLVEDDLLDKAKVLASNTFTFEEFIMLHKNRFPTTRLNHISSSKSSTAWSLSHKSSNWEYRNY